MEMRAPNPDIKERRKRWALVVEAKRSRAALSLGSFVTLGLMGLILACLCGGAAAYSPSGLAPPSMAPPSVATAAAKLLVASNGYLGPSHFQAVENATHFAAEAHEGQLRKSGDPYVVHTFETDCILAEMRAPSSAVVAGLLNDVVEDTDFGLDLICERSGSEVANILSGETDGESLPTHLKKEETDAHNKKELLLAMAGDLNMVLVKLADRVQIMRTLGAMPAHKRANKAKDTMELFVHLAQAVGVTPLEKELRALSASHLLGDKAKPLAKLASSLGAKKTRTPGLWLDEAGMGAQIMGLAAESSASRQCPALLAEYLERDRDLREADLGAKLGEHKAAWASHCAMAGAPHLSSVFTSKSAGTREKARLPAPDLGKPAWLGKKWGANLNEKLAPGQATDRLRALYASALIAGFANVPSALAFGADAKIALDSLSVLFQNP